MKCVRFVRCSPKRRFQQPVNAGPIGVYRLFLAVAVLFVLHTTSASGKEWRYLLVVETSRAMAQRQEPAAKAIRDLILTNMRGEARPGDSLGFWTFNDVLRTGEMPLQRWSGTNAAEIAERAAKFLLSRTNENSGGIECVMKPLLQIAERSDGLTAIFVTAGQPITGTPFDEAINEVTARWRAYQDRKALPFLTVLRCENGKISDYAVTPLPWPLSWTWSGTRSSSIAEAAPAASGNSLGTTKDDARAVKSPKAAASHALIFSGSKQGPVQLQVEDADVIGDEDDIATTATLVTNTPSQAPVPVSEPLMTNTAVAVSKPTSQPQTTDSAKHGHIAVNESQEQPHTEKVEVVEKQLSQKPVLRTTLTIEPPRAPIPNKIADNKSISVSSEAAMLHATNAVAAAESERKAAQLSIEARLLTSTDNAPVPITTPDLSTKVAIAHSATARAEPMLEQPPVQTPFAQPHSSVRSTASNSPHGHIAGRSSSTTNSGGTSPASAIAVAGAGVGGCGFVAWLMLRNLRRPKRAASLITQTLQRQNGARMPTSKADERDLAFKSDDTRPS